MVHGKKSCPFDNLQSLCKNHSCWTACDCFISIMEKAIKISDVSFLAKKYFVQIISVIKLDNSLKEGKVVFT